MRNFSILKRLAGEKAEPYAFPDAMELQFDVPAPSEEEPINDLEAEAAAETEQAEAPPPSPETPIDFAKLEAELILQDARRRADEIVEQAQRDAKQQSEALFQDARSEGERVGYNEGLERAMQEGLAYRETLATEMQEQIAQFLEKATTSLNQLMEQSVDDLRDLAIAVAEKIVRISLKSSGDVIGKMIQSAIDKHKRQEWVHIYIADSDAKRLVPIPKQLASALSALSGRARIIPMADDESGTCIVEMPDAIIDASVSTQLSNIRNALTGAPANDAEIDLQFNFRPD